MTLYSLLPLQGPEAGAARDALDGEKLAVHDSGARAGRYALGFRSVDTSAGGMPTRRSAAAAAQLPDTDPVAIGAVGGLGGDEAGVELPLLNAAGLAFVSPGATYSGLTVRRGVQAPDEPARFYPSGRRSFARVIGNDVSQAPALVALARASGCRALEVQSGPGAQEHSLAELVAGAGQRAGLALGAAGGARTCVVLAYADPAAAAAQARSLHARSPRALILGPAALVGPAFAGRLGASAASVRLLSPVPAPADLSVAASRFAGRFSATFGRAPGPWAYLGYDAMSALIDAIRRAGRHANDRRAVVDALLPGAARSTLLGTASFTPAGDVTPVRWATARVRGGRVVPGAPLP